MPVVLTNCYAFTEIPGRRRTLKFSAFDGLVITVQGPTYLKDIWIPAIGAPHPDYPLMQCNGISDVEQDGALTTITITYVGWMHINGYTQAPVVTTREVETSGSYQVADSIVVNPGTPRYNLNFGVDYGVTGVPGGAILVPNYTLVKYVGVVRKIGTYTVNVRYLSKQAIVRYQTQNRPGDPQQGGLAKGFVGYKVLSVDRSQLSGTNVTDNQESVNVSASHSFKVMCSNFSVTPVAPFAFDCEEIWEYKYLSSVSWFP